MTIELARHGVKRLCSSLNELSIVGEDWIQMERSVRYNYHMHSCYSDATNTPEELVEFAIEHGIKSTALTDHDTVDGVDAFMSVAAGADLEAIPGVEISSRIGQKFVHILGYGIDIKNVELLDLLDTLTEEATDYTKNVFVNM